VPDTGWAKSGTHMAWGQDFTDKTDALLTMVSPVKLPYGARLQFNHAYAFEEGQELGRPVAYDGSVIEYNRMDGRGWLDAGKLIVAGDTYDPNVPITSSSGNPLAGRHAFAGNSYGYTASQLDLASFASSNVLFRFRVGTDEAVGNIGWVIDDVRLYTCQSSISVLPTQLTFAQQIVGTVSNSQDVSIKNTGTLPFTTRISVTADFRMTNTCPSSLPSGASCVIHVAFVPSAAGPRTGQITIGDGAPSVALAGTGLVAPPESILCYAFNDGYTAMTGPSDAIYISGRPNDRGKACLPDGSATGQCRKWFGRCFGARTGLPVNFSAFDDGYRRATAPTDALFVNGQNSLCIPDGTAAGTCRKWFGQGIASDGRTAACSVFDDGAARRSALVDAIYIPSPLPLGGSACIPDGTSKGTCRRWFGMCELR